MDKFHHCGQRGQTIVEFAFVLPLFMLILMGIIEFGMAFSDYSDLQNVARSTARAAALGQSEKDIRASAAKNANFLVYTWNPQDASDFQIDIPQKNGSKWSSDDVTVTLRAKQEKTSFLHYVTSTLGSSEDGYTIHITYKMYYEAR